MSANIVRDMIGRKGVVVEQNDKIVVFRQANGSRVQMPKWSVKQIDAADLTDAEFLLLDQINPLV